MYCNPCKYKNIDQIKIYNTVVDECYKCNYCSIPFDEYINFILDAIISNHFSNINIFTIIDTLSNRDQNKYSMIMDYFLISAQNLKETNNICRICGEKLYEIKKDKNFSIYICKNCSNVFFEKEKFKSYLKKKIKIINRYYYFINIKERFLRLIKKGSKNNVKE